MVKLTHAEMRVVDDTFDMGGGYVLDFSDRTMAEFFDDEFGITIYYYGVISWRAWAEAAVRRPAGSRGTGAGAASAPPPGADAGSRSSPGCAAPGAREDPRGR